ncbi:putative microtubule-associated protein [Helianthus anomalus]
MEDLTVNGGNNIAGNLRTPMAETTTFNASRSFREGGRVSGTGSRRRTAVRPSLDADEFMNLLHGSDPVKVELNRLENEVRGD